MLQRSAMNRGAVRKKSLAVLNCGLTTLWLTVGLSFDGVGKSYSSGGGHSSSSSSRSSSSSSSSRSSSPGGSHSSSSGPSRSSSSGGGSKSYSSGPSSSGERKGYSATKSYTAGSGTKYSSTPDSGKTKRPSKPAPAPSAPPSGSDFKFDSGAARARKEQASKSEFARFKETQNPPSTPPVSGSRPAVNESYAAKPPPVANSVGQSGSFRRTAYVPDITIVQTRPSRIYNVFSPYSYRPWVTYRDPYGSSFWWWLLDRSIDDQAWWAYHHRYDMDPARYQALLASNQQLETRVADLEGQRVERDPAYTPAGLDRDLMYSDRYVTQTFSNRPTRGGAIAFWVFGVPAAAGTCAFFIWLIWIKRWQPAT